MSATLNTSDLKREIWLKRYYFLRAIFSLAWVILALFVGVEDIAIAGLLLVVYPAWDAIANWIDSGFSGGMAKNPTQRFNVWVSGITALAVSLALSAGMGAVIGVIGVWAIASGLLQLSTAVRRWQTHGAQWVMILSGAQSALAGGIFIAQSRMETPPSIENVAGYASVGAAYFLVSGIWLTVSHMRRGKQQSTSTPTGAPKPRSHARHLR